MIDTSALPRIGDAPDPEPVRVTQSISRLICSGSAAVLTNTTIIYFFFKYFILIYISLITSLAMRYEHALTQWLFISLISALFAWSFCQMLVASGRVASFIVNKLWDKFAKETH